MTRNIVKSVLKGTWSVFRSLATCGCVVLVLPFFTAGLIVVKCRRCIKHHSRQGRRVYLKSETFHPLPLPLRRRFNISDPNIPLASQPHSRLLSLPYEVRELIWEFALKSPCSIDICHKRPSNRLHHVTVPDEAFIEHFQNINFTNFSIDGVLSELNQVASLLRFKPSFPLAKTCRQIYTECMPILYGQNSFRFMTLDNVCFFNQGIRRQYSAKLRSISLVLRLVFTPETLESWVSAWFQIKTWMTGLRSLRIEVGLVNFPTYAERKLLMAALEINELESFKARFWNMSNREPAQISLGKFGKLLEKAMTRRQGNAIDPSLRAKLHHLSSLVDGDEDET